MNKLTENILNLFGLQIKPKADKRALSGQLDLDNVGDGSIDVLSSASLAGSFSSYLDTDGLIKSEADAIKKYREMSLFADVDIAISEIVNEAVPQEQDTKMVQLDLDELNVKENVKTKILNEFEIILKLFKYDERSAEYFNRFYVDGRIPFQIIVDKNNLSDGIQKLILLDALNIKKVREVKTKPTQVGIETIEEVNEYYVYNDVGFGANKTSTSSKTYSPTSNLKISKDAIIFVTSGVVDQNTGMIMSHLHKAIRPINQLRMLEDATVVYFIARAPERRAFYVDTGNLPKLKAEQYMKELMNRYRNKMVYDAKTGDIKNDKKYISALEDFWLPRRDGGKGTEIESLPGAQNISGYLDSLTWFKEKMYEALNIPKSRLQQESGFSLGKSQEITRDEVKFQKFVDRLRNKFGQILLEALKTQLILKGICNTEEWDEIKAFIKLDFQKDNYFAELKNQEILQSRFEMLQQVDNYLQKYVSKRWVQKNVLMLTDEDIKDMDAQMSKESDDETAQPDWKIQANFQMEQQQQMMGQQGDPNDPNAPVSPAAPPTNFQAQGAQ